MRFTNFMNLLFLCFILIIEYTKRSLSPYIVKFINIDENRMLLYENKLKKIQPSILKVITIYSCFIAPFIEEFVFRFLPYTFLSTTLCFVVTVPLFGLFHMINYSNYSESFTKEESLKTCYTPKF